MDLRKLSEVAVASTTVELPQGGSVVVRGANDPKVQAAWRNYKEVETARLVNYGMSGASKGIESTAKLLDDRVDALAIKAVESWDGITDGDEPAELTHENIKFLFGAKGPFKELLLNAIAESSERFLSSGGG